MRVLTVLNDLGLGGIEKMLLRAIPYLKESGIDTNFCCLGKENVLDQEFEALGCKIWRIPKSANCMKTAKALERILEHQQYSLVHSQFGYTSGGLALGAARKGIPCLISIHSSKPLSLYSWCKNPLLSIVRRSWLTWHRCLMEKHADTFIGHSRSNIAAFQPDWESDTSRYRVILNGINFPPVLESDSAKARESLNLPSKSFVLLHVGNFREVKNHKGLLTIFCNVLRKVPDALLVLVGDGPLRQDIMDHARQMGILGKIRFEGFQRSVWPYYRAADLFVFPSLSEGFGNVLVESAVSRLPIVASDIPAHRESIANSQHRFLFPQFAYDRAAELVKIQLEASRAGVNSWVNTSETFARQSFSIERFARDLSDTYEGVLKNVA